MLVAVAFYEVVIALHILAVVLAFGATFAYPVIFAVAAKDRARCRLSIARSTRSASV